MAALVALILCCAGCTGLKPVAHLPQPTETQLAWVGAVAPRAVSWVTEQESSFLIQGRPLLNDEIDLARAIGIQFPDRVRIVVTERFPVPQDPLLSQQVGVFGFDASNQAGCSFGYAVVVKPRYVETRWLLAHELVHVAQRERLGMDAFVRQYLLEVRTLGYARAPLEREAKRAMSRAQ